MLVISALSSSERMGNSAQQASQTSPFLPSQGKTSGLTESLFLGGNGGGKEGQIFIGGGGAKRTALQ